MTVLKRFDDALTSRLIKFLPRKKIDIIIIEDKISLEYVSLTKSFEGAIVLDETPMDIIPKTNLKPRKPTEKKDTLQNIIDRINSAFASDFTDGDRVIVEGVFKMFMQDAEIKKFKKKAKDNSSEMFVKSLFPDKFQEIVTQCYMNNTESFQKLFTDTEFYNRVMDAMAKEVYKSLRKD